MKYILKVVKVVTHDLCRCEDTTRELQSRNKTFLGFVSASKNKRFA